MKLVSNLGKTVHIFLISLPAKSSSCIRICACSVNRIRMLFPSTIYFFVSVPAVKPLKIEAPKTAEDLAEEFDQNLALAKKINRRLKDRNFRKEADANTKTGIVIRMIHQKRFGFLRVEGKTRELYFRFGSVAQGDRDILQKGESKSEKNVENSF